MHLFSSASVKKCGLGAFPLDFPCRTGWSGSGGAGAEAQRLFLPEPDTRKPRLTRVARQAQMPINSNRKESLRRRRN